VKKVKFKKGTIESLVRNDSRPATAVRSFASTAYDTQTMGAKSFTVIGDASVLGVR